MPWGVYITITAPVAITAATLLFLILRKWIPALRVVDSPVERSALRRAENAEDELARANDEISKLEKERDDLLKERSLAAVIELVEKVALGVDKTLGKLADLNGGLKASAIAHEIAAEALKEVGENLKTSTKATELLASQIIVNFREKN